LLFGGTAKADQAKGKNSKEVEDTELGKSIRQKFEDDNPTLFYTDRDEYKIQYKEYKKALVGKANEALKDYKDEINNWNSFLRNVFIPAKQGKTGIIKNAVTVPFWLKDQETKKDGALTERAINRFSSHLIQGEEARVMLLIVAKLKEISTCVHWDHDGGVFDQKLSQKQIDQLMDEVKTETGLTMKFVRKEIDP